MIGNLRMRVDLDDLELVKHKAVKEQPQKNQGIRTGAEGFKVASPGVELSLRGMTVDEALDRLEHYLDRAYLAGLPYVRIVHGKGTGKLRDAVRQEMSTHPYIQRFESGKRNEGGDGVTVGFLVKG